MPPVDPNNQQPIDIVARPVNPDGTLGDPTPDPTPGPDFMHLAFPGQRTEDEEPRREEVRYYHVEGRSDDGCGCSGCGCLTAIVMLMLLFLLKACGL